MKTARALKARQIAVAVSLILTAVVSAQEAGSLLWGRTVLNPTPAYAELFSISMSAVGVDRLIVAAPWDQTAGPNAGAAYLIGGNGALLTTFLNPEPTNSYGFGLCVRGMDSQHVLIARPANAIQPGAVYLYDVAGNQQRRFESPAAPTDDEFGGSFAGIGDHMVAIGAEASDKAYIFATDGRLVTTLTSPNPQPPANWGGEFFGRVLCGVGTNMVVVSAPLHDDGVRGAGIAYLFRTSGELLATFRNPTPDLLENFGSYGVTVGPDRVLISAPGHRENGIVVGAAYLFNLQGDLLTTFRKSAVAPATAAEDGFGRSVAALGESELLISAPKEGSQGANAGAVYRFDLQGNLLQTIHNPHPYGGGLFGIQLAPLGSCGVAIGSSGADFGAVESGALFIYGRAPVLTNGWAMPNVLWPPNGRMTRVSVGAEGLTCWPFQLRIKSVTCDDPRFDPSDVRIMGNTELELRATNKGGHGLSRTYTIWLEAVDEIGILSEPTLVTVSVENGRRLK